MPSTNSNTDKQNENDDQNKSQSQNHNQSQNQNQSSNNDVNDENITNTSEFPYYVGSSSDTESSAELIDTNLLYRTYKARNRTMDYGRGPDYNGLIGRRPPTRINLNTNYSDYRDLPQITPSSTSTNSVSSTNNQSNNQANNQSNNQANNQANTSLGRLNVPVGITRNQHLLPASIQRLIGRRLPQRTIGDVYDDGLEDSDEVHRISSDTDIESTDDEVILIHKSKNKDKVAVDNKGLGKSARRKMKVGFYSCEDSPVKSEILDKCEDLCLICYGDIKCERVIELGCKHVFHAVCVKKWVKVCAVCPMCKSKIEVRFEKRDG